MRTNSPSVAAICACGIALLLAGGCAKSPAPPTATTGTIRGVVKYAGKKPDPKPIPTAIDPYCQSCWRAAGKDKIFSERWVWGDNDTLVNVLVWVSSGLDNKTVAPPKEQVVVLDLATCQYVPHVVGVQLGQPFVISSLDRTTHFPTITSNVEPMVGAPMLPASPDAPATLPFRFAQAEIGKVIQCQVHGWELAYVHVLPHPFFDITRQSGAFEIKDLPPGEYELSAWHEMKVFGPDEATIRVKVEAGKTSEAIFTFRPRRAN